MLPCATPGACPAGQECLANRCVVQGYDPVAAGTRRIVVEPSALSVVSAKGEGDEGSVTFGGRATGAVALHLAFAGGWREAGRVESAFLLLDAVPGSPPGRDDVPVVAWRVAGAALRPPFGRGVARSSPPSPLRIDVTEIVRFLVEHPRADQGIAVVATAGEGHGASYLTGAAGGAAPRLEIYLAGAVAAGPTGYPRGTSTSVASSSSSGPASPDAGR